MEASVRLFAGSSVPRSLLRLHRRPHFGSRLSLPRNSNPSPINLRPFAFWSIPLSISSSRFFSLPSSDLKSSSPHSGWVTNGFNEGKLGFRGELGEAWMVVLLGWLGAEPKHLKRYAELYGEKGITAVRFVVPIGDVLGVDLGRRVEERVARLAEELVDWCSEMEKSGKEPRLIFHTFSNTGWLAYGAILNNLLSRDDVAQNIKGCIFDSGGAPELNPQIWAAGFATAFLKKRSSLAYSSAEFDQGKLDHSDNSLSNQANGPQLIEIVLLGILTKLFTILLGLPDVNRRLSWIVSILSEKQPCCPQLYLYSSSDKVIPASSIKRFIEKQRALGRTVDAHDFVSSPHVDHLRSFPHIYSSKVNEFLKECCSACTYQI